MSAAAGFAAIAREDGRAALVTVVRSPGSPALGAKLLVSADGSREGTLGDAVLDEQAAAAAGELMWAERSELLEQDTLSLFVDITCPAPRLVAFGAVDYAAALCRLARICGWRPIVVDPRSQFATAERFPDAEAVVVEWPDRAFAAIGGIDRATHIVVLTHDPKLDDAALEIALRSPAAYVGAMGSRRAQAERRERLTANGISSEELERLAAPVGLDLGATSSEETALSIMAEVVAVRHGRTGGRLTEAGSARIHEVDLIGGAILAAGEGRRFGGPKQLAELNGRPLLEHAIAAMNDVGELEQIVVVLGAHARKILGAVDFGRAEPVICDGWREGIAASLRRALRAHAGADPLVIALGDQPGLTPGAVRAVLRASLSNPGASAARAVYAGVPGHPVAIRAALRDDLMRLGGDRGAALLLGGAIQVDCGGLAVGSDVDTPEQLAALAAHGSSSNRPQPERS